MNITDEPEEKIDWEDLQEPTGASDWTKPVPNTTPKCCICGDNADRLVPVLGKWICDWCCHPLSAPPKEKDLNPSKT